MSGGCLGISDGGQVAKALGLKDFGVVSFSGGAPSALGSLPHLSLLSGLLECPDSSFHLTLRLPSLPLLDDPLQPVLTFCRTW